MEEGVWEVQRGEGSTGVLGDLSGRRHLEELGIDTRAIQAVSYKS